MAATTVSTEDLATVADALGAVDRFEHYGEHVAVFGCDGCGDAFEVDLHDLVERADDMDRDAVDVDNGHGFGLCWEV